METVSSKVPLPMVSEIDDFAEEIGESRSVAVRHLLRDGLDSQGESMPMYQVVAWLGSLLLASLLTPASASMASLLGVLGLLLFLGGLAWPLLRRRYFSTPRQEVR